MVTIPKYETINSVRYENMSDVNKLLGSVGDAVVYVNPFMMILFGVLLAFMTASYFSQIKLIGNQRFFNSLLASSFATFLVSILFSLLGVITPMGVMIFVAISVIALGLCVFYR